MPNLLKEFNQNEQWTVIQRGAALCQLQLISIIECLNRERIKDFSMLNKIANQISKTLQYGIGRGNWQVIIYNGKQYARKFQCSGSYYLIIKRYDGLTVFIWLNKIKGVNYK